MRHPNHTLAELAAAIAAAGGNKTVAARALGISREALRLRLQRHPALARAVKSARARANRPCPRCGGAGVIQCFDSAET